MKCTACGKDTGNGLTNGMCDACVRGTFRVQVDQTLALCERAEWLYCVQTYLLMLHVDEPYAKDSEAALIRKIKVETMAQASKVPSALLNPDTMATQAVEFVDWSVGAKPKPSWLE